ncbi:hypothetical protein M011DRAFT_469277 [Sporormia fimetaria CBS 119925]|uniref:Uncharacterized protein n=1 Tax=Sporormia fimetaria CBS 119925 TaxID=1340428 RepID=A0A6A6V8H6_9PLEO|nr:hypothetical protein M011DRAFT_469277 [Sporormia fimetaria CBS 119925]
MICLRYFEPADHIRKRSERHDDSPTPTNAPPQPKAFAHDETNALKSNESLRHR